MPRTARILIDGGTYHVMSRGNNGQPVFHAEPDFERYLRLLRVQLRTQPLCLLHYALMPNHVHLVLRAELGRALSTAMLRLNLTYSHYYRKRYEYTGHLWQGRFKSALITTDTYLLECGRYVELNPVRAGLAEHPAQYAWTSYRAYAEGTDSALVTLARHPLHDTLGATARERQAAYEQFVLGGLQAQQPQRTDGMLLPSPPRPDRVVRRALGITTMRAGRPRLKTIPTHDT